MKNGKTKAHIEIEIVSNAEGKIVCFHRTFDKDSKEVYKVDGVKVARKEYLRQVKQLNIQVDNLCMFLPQDRVQDFTKMNPQQLLHNTQISVCPPEITAAFEKLLEIRKTQKNNSVSKDALQTRLCDSINRKEQLQTIIESNRLKDRLIAKLGILMKKKAWLEFGKVKAELQQVEADLKKLTDKIKAANLKIQPLKAKQDQTAELKNTLKNAISKAATSIKQTVDEMDKLNDGADKVEDDVNKAKRDLRNAIESAQDFKKQLSEMEILVDLERNELQQAIDEYAQNGNVNEQIKALDMKVQAMKAQQEALMKKRNEITKSLDEQIVPSIRNCERKIATITDTQKQRIDILRSNFEDAYKAFTWLQSNRSQFRGQIFNPIMVEITVNHKDYAKYIESTIATKDLTAFVCTDKDDMKQLIVKLRNEMNLQVNVAFSEDTDQINFETPCEITDYPPNLGLYSYLIDMFKGPAPIINYLCRLYSIHTVVVGDDQTFKNASNIPNNIRLFFSTNHRFSVNISRYSNAKSLLSSAIQDRNILNIGIDARMKDREERNLERWKMDAETAKTNRASVEADIKKNEGFIAEVRSEKNEIQKFITHIKISTAKLKTKEAELETLKNQEVNIAEERNKFKLLVSRSTTSLDTINKRRILTLLQYKGNFINQALARKKLQVFDGSTGNVDEEIRILQNELQSTTNLRETIKNHFVESTQLCKRVEDKALNLTDGFSPDHPKFKYKKDFSQLPDNIEQLLESVGELQGRIDCMKGVDPQVIVEFEALTKAIIEMEQQVSDETYRLAKMEQDLENLHQTWYPAIQKIVDVINGNFSNFFHLMGFVGEVELIRKGDVSKKTETNTFYYSFIF